MEDFLSHQFRWLDLLLTALGLLGCHVVLRGAERLLALATTQRKLANQARKLVHDLLTLFEPLGFILLCSVFIFINPPFHGLLLALLILAGFSHVKNYMSGRFIHLDRAFEAGIKLKTNQIQGVISRLGKFGLHLQTTDGPHHIPYSKLLYDGYTLVSGKESGGFCHLKIRLDPAQPGNKASAELMEILATTPFLDLNYKPELLPVNEEANFIEAKVLLREDGHLFDLRRLLKELGYHCQEAVNFGNN